MSYIFRELKKEDYFSFNETFTEIFGKVRDESFWQWKYHKNPAGECFSVVAVKDGKVVSHIGSLPVRFWVNGEVKKACHEVEVFCHSAHRREGTFLKLYEFYRRKTMELGIAFSCDLPTPTVFKVGTTLLKYCEVSPIPKLVKILDANSFLLPLVKNEILAKCIGKIAKPFLNMTAGFNKKVRFSGHFQIKEIKRFDNRFDNFWSRVADDYPICLVRDSRFLNWRYVDIPVTRYKIFYLEDDKEIKGYIVLFISKDRRGYIIDILTRRGDQLASETLLDFAIQYFKKSQIAIIICWMFSHTHIFEILKKYGFRRRETTNRWLMIRGYQTDENFMKLALDYKNWYITLGDSDDY